MFYNKMKIWSLFTITFAWAVFLKKSFL